MKPAARAAPVRPIEARGSARVCLRGRGRSGVRPSNRQLTALGVACQVLAPALTPPGSRETGSRPIGGMPASWSASSGRGAHADHRGRMRRGKPLGICFRCREDVPRGSPALAPTGLGKFRPATAGCTAEGPQLDRSATGSGSAGQRFDPPRPGAHLPTKYRLCGRTTACPGSADLDREIAALARDRALSRTGGWLRCFRGIDTLAALTLLAELGTFSASRIPGKLMAYFGLVPSEHSSGDRTKRGSITKAGNTHVRRNPGRSVLALSAPAAARGRVGPPEARGSPPSIRAQPGRPQLRLHRRYRHLAATGKAAPPVAVVGMRPRNWSASSGPR